MDNTIIQQGYFTSDGTDKIISLRSDVDWVKVYNLTNIAGATQWDSLTWYWQREMAEDDSILEYHVAADQTVSMSTSAVGFNGAVFRGISLIDTSDKTLSASIATTASTDATRPVVSTGSTTRLSDGVIVRLAGTAQTNLNGLDFSIDTIVHDTSFRLANTIATAPGVVGGAGTYRRVAASTAAYDFIYPGVRTICNVSQAANAIVTTLVNHSYTVGQKVRFSVDTRFGMVELDEVVATVTAVTAGPPNTFTIDVDTTGFTAFNFMTAAEFTANITQHPTVVPYGIDTAYNTSALTAVENRGFIGMILGTSSDAAIASGSPGGTNGDVIKWVAGKSFATDIG